VAEPQLARTIRPQPATATTLTTPAPVTVQGGGPTPAGNQAFNLVVDALLEQAAAAVGVRTDTVAWRDSVEAAKTGTKQAIRRSVMGAVGSAEGGLLAVTGLLDDLIYIPYGIIDLTDYTVARVGEAGGLTPEQIEVAQALAHIVARDDAAMLKAARAYLAGYGMTDELTGAPIVSGLVTRPGTYLEETLNATLGLPAEEGFFTTREINQIAANVAAQLGLAEIGVREVQAVLKVAALAGAVRSMVSAAAEATREGKKWYASPKFWVLVGAALLSLVGLKQTTAARKLLQLFVDIAVATLSVAPAVITLFDHLANYHKEDRDKVLHQDAVAVATAAANALAQLITGVVKQSSRASAGPRPGGPAEATGPGQVTRPAETTGPAEVAAPPPARQASDRPAAEERAVATVPEPAAAVTPPTTVAPPPPAPTPTSTPAAPAGPAIRPRAGGEPRPPAQRSRSRVGAAGGVQRGAKRRTPVLRERGGPRDRPESQRLRATGTGGAAGPEVVGGGQVIRAEGIAGPTGPRAVIDNVPEGPTGAPQTGQQTGQPPVPTTTETGAPGAGSTLGTGGPATTTGTPPPAGGTGARRTASRLEAALPGPEWKRVRARIQRLRRRIADLPQGGHEGATRRALEQELGEAVERLKTDSPDAANEALSDLEQSAREATRLSRPVTAEGLAAFRERLQREIEEARGQRARDVQELIDRTDALLADLKAGKEVNTAQALEDMQRQLGRAGRQDYVVHVPLHDETYRAQVRRDLESLTEGMENYPGGDAARVRLLDKFDSLDQMDLVQSPRAAGGENLVDTQPMREAFTNAVEAGKLGEEYRQAFDEARGQNDWPHTPDGRPWELDHIIELWQSGRDDLTNIIALDPRLHALKTRALEIFRRKYRDANRVEGAQTDPRERDPD
jgi:hypothetical protein